MPLSEHEQKMLEQMEQALAAEDPKFASQMQGSSLASLQRRRWLVGAVGVIAGLALVLYTMVGWWRDVISESVDRGDHTPVVKLGLRFGMLQSGSSEGGDH